MAESFALCPSLERTSTLKCWRKDLQRSTFGTMRQSLRSTKISKGTSLFAKVSARIKASHILPRLRSTMLTENPYSRQWASTLFFQFCGLDNGVNLRGKRIPVTVSLGLSALDDSIQSVESFFKRHSVTDSFIEICNR